MTDDPASRITILDQDRSTVERVRSTLAFLKAEFEVHTDPRSLLGGFERRAPECLILSVQLLDMSGLEVHRELVKAHTAPPVVFLSSLRDMRTAVRAMKQGAFDFLERDFGEQALVDTVQAALRKDVRPLRPRIRNTAILSGLTPREREVLEEVIAGRSSKEIAVRLGISRKTVELHRAHIMKKLEVHSVANLVSTVLA